MDFDLKESWRDRMPGLPRVFLAALDFVRRSPRLLKWLKKALVLFVLASMILVFMGMIWLPKNKSLDRYNAQIEKLTHEIQKASVMAAKLPNLQESYGLEQDKYRRNPPARRPGAFKESSCKAGAKQRPR